jgi:hypothetical protein
MAVFAIVNVKSDTVALVTTDPANIHATADVVIDVWDSTAMTHTPLTLSGVAATFGDVLSGTVDEAVRKACEVAILGSGVASVDYYLMLMPHIAFINMMPPPA